MKSAKDHNRAAWQHRRRLYKWVLYSLAILVTLSLVIPTLPARAGEANSWLIYQVDDPAMFMNMTDRSLRFDTNGYPHVAYGGDHLYYSWYNGTAWQTQTIDNSVQVGEYAALALDSQNNPRISYYDALNGALKFAYRLSGSWFVEVVDTPTQAAAMPRSTPEYPTIEQLYPQLANPRGRLSPSIQIDQATDAPGIATSSHGLGLYTSIAVDKANIVHISYYDKDNGLLKYANWNGQNWAIQTVDGDPAHQLDMGKWSSIAVDSSNRPHISYMNEKYDGLRYARWNGSNWNITDVDSLAISNENVGAYSSLALDSDDLPHISYLNFTQGSNKLKYATRTSGGSWTITTLDATTQTGWNTSITVNSSGTVFISYRDYENGDLEYAKGSGTTWNFKTLASSGDTGFYTSIALDKNGQPGVAFYQASSGQYQFTRYNKNTDKWSTSTIHAGGDTGLSTSLDLNNSIPYISYFNDTTDNLWNAFRGGGYWFFKELAKGAGTYNSLKLNSSGHPRIAFHDASVNYLRYIYWQGTSWVLNDVDKNSGVGRYVALGIDNIGAPHMSYYDNVNDNLKYAYWNGSAWVVQVVDTPGNVGQFTSLALNSANSPFISYYDVTNSALKYAYRTQTGVWLNEVVDNTADVGQYSSLGLDLFGNPYIAYYDATNGDLKFAVKQAGIWNISVVDSSNDVGMYASLAIDSLGQAHISYYDASFGDLKYAYGSSGGWSPPETVDSFGDVGQYTSLSLNENEMPAISYYDYSDGSLKLATTFFLNSYTTFLPIVKK